MFSAKTPQKQQLFSQKMDLVQFVLTLWTYFMVLPLGDLCFGQGRCRCKGCDSYFLNMLLYCTDSRVGGLEKRSWSCIKFPLIFLVNSFYSSGVFVVNYTKLKFIMKPF